MEEGTGEGGHLSLMRCAIVPRTLEYFWRCSIACCFCCDVCQVAWKGRDEGVEAIKPHGVVQCLACGIVTRDMDYLMCLSSWM